MKVLVADDLSAEGVEILRKGKGLAVDVKVGLQAAELKAIIGEYDALAVRSVTQVTAEIIEAATQLRVIGRAGVGLDNIDQTAATRRGIVVMNTPGGNTITVAELTVAHLLALSRHLPQATASMKAGKWEKKKFQGREVFDKTLGLVGLGNIGSVVADRCLGLKMKVIAYDPFISEEAAKQMGVELVTLDQLYARADYVSVHVPLNDQTQNLINQSALARMKKGAFLVNCARGGIVDEAALAEALSSGHLGGAALDVFATEPAPADHPLFKLDNFISTPHLGASTEEAQLNVSLALAEQMVDYLVNGNTRNTTNAASISREQLERLGPWLILADKLGRMAGQLAPEGITGVELHASGDVNPISGLTVCALKGLLSQFIEGVNEVNAPVLAKERGIKVLEQRSAEHASFVSSLKLKVTGNAEVTVEGTLFGKRDPRIVRVNQFDLEAVPEGHLIALHNTDVPGVVGKIGTVLGESGVNIGRIHLSRATHEAFSLLNIDSEPTAAVLDSLRGIQGVKSVRKLTL